MTIRPFSTLVKQIRTGDMTTEELRYLLNNPPMGARDRNKLYDILSEAGERLVAVTQRAETAERDNTTLRAIIRGTSLRAADALKAYDPLTVDPRLNALRDIRDTVALLAAPAQPEAQGERKMVASCAGCGAVSGQFHHAGCPYGSPPAQPEAQGEECPKCGKTEHPWGRCEPSKEA